MSRRGETITLSLSLGDKEKLEDLAIHFNCMWGKKPNISLLLNRIANKTISLSETEREKRIIKEIEEYKKEIEEYEKQILDRLKEITRLKQLLE